MWGADVGPDHADLASVISIWGIISSKWKAFGEI